MGCCGSRETSPEKELEQALMELARSRESMTQMERELSKTEEKLEGMRIQLEEYQTAVGERRDLAGIGQTLDQIEVDTQAQVISDLHSTNMQEAELRDNIRLRHIRKQQDALQAWAARTKAHLKISLSISALQLLQAELLLMLGQLKTDLVHFRKSCETLKRKIRPEDRIDLAPWKNHTERLNKYLLDLIAQAEELNQRLSSVTVKLRDTLSETKLAGYLEDVEACLGILNTEERPLGRKSYREISEEVLHLDQLTRTSTSDSVSHFERLLTKVQTSATAPMGVSVWTDVANTLLKLLVSKAKLYREKLATARPAEMDILEYFLSTYSQQATEAVRSFAKALDTMKTQEYAEFLARALCFSPERHLHFLPEVIASMQPLCRDFDWETGGYLSLTDLISLLESLFAKERDIGSIVMSQLATASLGTVSFFTLYLQYKLTKSHTSALELFHELDKRGKQTLSVSDFAFNLKRRFTLLALDEDLTALGEAMDTTKSGSIFRTEFISGLERGVETKTVSCVVVCKAFEASYGEIQAEQTYSLYQMFSEESGQDYRPSLSKIVPMIQRLRPGLSIDTISYLLTKTKLQYTGQMTFEEFREFVWRYDLKLPSESFFSQQLGERDQVEVSEELHELIAAL
jgi:hypothetical protein